MDPQTSDVKFWGALVTAILSTGAGVRWWYHVRRLQNADTTDGDVTKSISYVINTMKDEISRAKAEHIELRARLSALEAQNEEQRLEMEVLRAKNVAICAACGVKQ